MPQFTQCHRQQRDARLSVEFLLNDTKTEPLTQDAHEPSTSERIKCTWSDKLMALETFKAIHGHVVVPRTFQVPSNDPQWPVNTWGMHLGVLVSNLRTRDQPQDKRRQLNALGFVWDKIEFHWQINLLALRTYKEKFGHLHIPQMFEVPAEGGWPEETHGMKLGWVATTLRRTRGSMSALRALELEQLGFLSLLDLFILHLSFATSIS
ncbi:hypothetical protein AC1031_005049 [Aphanomyces cochlioides]|nr:hypothetical protein AC1031_005049 [Aphanomyces cochlioides]